VAEKKDAAEEFFVGNKGLKGAGQSGKLSNQRGNNLRGRGEEKGKTPVCEDGRKKGA